MIAEVQRCTILLTWALRDRKVRPSSRVDSRGAVQADAASGLVQVSSRGRGLLNRDGTGGSGRHKRAKPHIIWCLLVTDQWRGFQDDDIGPAIRQPAPLAGNKQAPYNM